MLRSQITLPYWIVLSACVLLTGLGGCTSSAPDTATGGKAPTSDNAGPPLAYPLPDGDSAKLLDYINQMAMQQPKGDTDDERTKDTADIFKSRLAAADKLIGGEDAEAYGVVAAKVKLESIKVLADIGETGAKQRYHDYAMELSNGSDAELARVGKYGLFFARLDEVLGSTEADGSSVVAEMKQLAADNPHDEELFFTIDQATDGLVNSGRADAGREATMLIVETYADHEDPELSKRAREIGSRIEMYKFEDAFAAVMQNADGAEDSLLELADGLMSESAPSSALGLVMDVSQRLENSSRLQLASKLYDRLDQSVDKATTADELLSMIRGGVKRAKTRIGLVGEKIELSGKTTYGKELYWSAYEDKVVLIDFWATWCGPCVQELPLIKEFADRFKSQGLEVIGINLDDDIPAAEKFIEENDISWPNLMSPADGNANPMADKMGVETIPFTVIVGRDGTAVATHLRGEKLAEFLNDMFEADDSELVLDVEESVEDEMEEAASDASDDDAQEAPNRTAKQDDGKVGLLNSSTEILLAQVDIEKKVDEQPASNLSESESEANPYEPEPGLSAKELVGFLLDMQDKTPSIQFRDGFREGVCVAADRLLAIKDAKEKARVIAATAKLDYLHRDACLGNEQADKELASATEQLKAESAEKIQRMVRFHEIERAAVTVVNSQQPGEPWDQETYDASMKYLGDEKESLSKRHLRLASSLVEIVNQNPDTKEREEKFAELSTLLAETDDSSLKRYAKRIGPSDDGEADWIGKPLELAGETIDGEDFSAADFRGKVILVDFWATWCGPCRDAMPELQAMYEKHHAAGLEVIGVSLDHDENALAEYLDENELPWTHITGESATAAAEKYGVRGIPSMLLVDRNGKILEQGRTAGDFADKIVELLK